MAKTPSRDEALERAASLTQSQLDESLAARQRSWEGSASSDAAELVVEVALGEHTAALAALEAARRTA
jgi:hypothetical protein